MGPNEQTMNPIDTYRDAFLRFRAEGMTYDEALSQFDEKDFTDAAMIELDSGLTRRVTFEEDVLKAGDFVTNDDRKMPALFDLLTHARHERRNGVHGEAYRQALDLWQAGWTSESPRPATNDFWAQVQVMSWYWRAPSKRRGLPGRKYLSTNQAWNALQREHHNTALNSSPTK